jgi:hypothetical protein
MADQDRDEYDEYDAILEEPLFLDSDVNWDAIEGRQLVEDTAQSPVQGQSVSSDEYFSPADLEVDESFLDQVNRIEARANAGMSAKVLRVLFLFLATVNVQLMALQAPQGQEQYCFIDTSSNNLPGFVCSFTLLSFS